MSFKQHPKVKYEDNHLLLLSKPAGMPTVPDSSRDFSLLDWGKAYLKKTRNKKGNVFLAVVHRLDRPVSGLVIFAITSKAASRLSEQLRKKRLKKKYLAVVKSENDNFRDQVGIIEGFLKKDHQKNMVKIVDENTIGAKSAITKWQILKRRQGHTLLKLCPITGRPHQLRVHLAKGLISPIVGDFKYGSMTKVLNGKGLALHSFQMEFVHPTKKKDLIFIDLPPNYYPFSIFSDFLENIVDN